LNWSSSTVTPKKDARSGKVRCQDGMSPFAALNA
jgi:hypothetical protein